MTTAVPDPRECQTCGYDEANHKREAHLYRPATAPDPRFRDQLEATAHRSIQQASWARGVAMLDSDVAAFCQRLLEDLMPLVEARVQAAANQRAAEDFAVLSELVEAVGRGDHVLPGAYRRAREYVRDRAATLDAEAGPSAG